MKVKTRKCLQLVCIYIYNMYIFYGRNVNTEYNYELVRTSYEFEIT